MEEPRWLDEQEMAAWKSFLAAGHLVIRRVEQQLKEDAGLSHPQYEVLVHLSDAPTGELRMTELADLLVTSKSGLSYQVGQLEKAGLVRRRDCPTDDRGVIAGLTERGWEKVRRTAPGHVAVVREAFIDILTRNQLSVLAEGLGAVDRGLRRR